MGICLDTESNTQTQEPDESGPGNDWKGGGGGGQQATINREEMTQTPVGGVSGATNAGKVKFAVPVVPVIFVLGGPGSGKVTHCDTIVQERRGLVHINMMDLLQQYAIGNDMQDFSQLSSKVVTEVLMLEMKMSPQARAYLVSGFPRSMRDVVEYSEKIQVVNGVVLISWRQAVLQKQIDYGAKLGHVVLSLAKMELENFFKHVMPVADYFDQSDMLIAVNGERTPSEVYQDFRAAILDVLSQQENQEGVMNGVAGMGHGIFSVPGSIVSVDTAPSKVARNTEPSPTHGNQHLTNGGPNVMVVNHVPPQAPRKAFEYKDNAPKIIWVIGGPGSNKATLCMKAVGALGWGHISIGKLLRAIADSDPKASTEEHAIKEYIGAGEMVPRRMLDNLINTNISALSDRPGIIIDGYPRDIDQATYFEQMHKQMPPIILLDCSKLQLGRGRLDDTVASFRRRLELFRELTLPMLKQMDKSGRLTIIDGDTESPSVQRDFERVVRNQVEQLVGSTQILNVEKLTDNYTAIGTFKEQLQGGNVPHETEVPGVVPTISRHVANGQLKGVANGNANGFIPNGRLYNNHI